jgi:glycosyltransferase involved in cell wall biosynthesis
MMKGLLCSVIIPSYNHQEYIIQAVTSVINQTYENIEIIVIDDGSTDLSLKYLKEMSDPRLKVISQANSGAHAAINRGLSLAKGDFLAILNSDDLYYNRRIEKAIDFFEMNPNIEFISTWIELINKNDRTIGIKEGWSNLEPWRIERPEKSYQMTNDFTLNSLMWNFVATTSNFIMRRSVFEAIGSMRNLRFAHDWDYLLRIVCKFKCHLLPETLIKYRIHDRNTIYSDRKLMLFEICWLLATHIPNFEGRFIFNTNEQESILSDFEMLYESINFQGNDKLYWVMRSFFESQRKRGISNPEESLLETGLLKEGIIRMVIEDGSCHRSSFLSKLQMVLTRLLK